MLACWNSNQIMTIVKFAEAHQEFCLLLLTAVLAFCAFVSCVLAYKNIKTMKDSEIERARPIVVLEIVADFPCYEVRMKNTGLTAARNITVELTPSVVYCYDSWKGKSIGFLCRTVEFLPPNSVLQTNIGTFRGIEAYNPSLMHKGFIRYEDAAGRKYKDAVVLDFSLFKDTVLSGKKTLNDLGVELEKIRKVIELFGSGFHKLRVIAQSLDDYREEERRFIEDAECRLKAETLEKDAKVPLQSDASSIGERPCK